MTRLDSTAPWASSWLALAVQRERKPAVVFAPASCVSLASLLLTAGWLTL
jgi:hypothetical protein